MCDGCGADIVALGEYYMVSREVWQQQLGLGWDDNLCIGCLEKRLGRKLTALDFITWPSYPWMRPSSLRLTSRIFGASITTRKPYRIRASCRDLHMTRAAVKAIGEYLADERRQAVCN